MMALRQLPYQKDWAEKLQQIQLKREVAGTSKIEGAEFTDKELDAALRETPEQLETRSQRQAAAAVATYRWIGKLPADRPVDETLIQEIHRRIVMGADDDHCAPGRLRERDHNVTFGAPQHRGAEGGEECQSAFSALAAAINGEYLSHDPLIQALAAHYHFASMHPFADGNGRTARAMEALFLQRTGLGDSLFIAMSNYYYEEKNNYLGALAAVRAGDHDLTPFLRFGLRGIEVQCKRLMGEIVINLRKAMFRNVMFDLFNRLYTQKRRVMKNRQIEILKLLLERDQLPLDELRQLTSGHYAKLGNPNDSYIRDLNYLLGLNAIRYEQAQDKRVILFPRLDWPTEITETDFYQRIKTLPKGKMFKVLS